MYNKEKTFTMDIHLFPVKQISSVDYRIYGLEEDELPFFKSEIVSNEKTGNYFFPLIVGAPIQDKVSFVQEDMNLCVFDSYAIFVEEDEFDQAHMLFEGFSLSKHHHRIFERSQGVYSLDIVIETKGDEIFWLTVDHSFCNRRIGPGVLKDILSLTPLFIS